MPEHVQQWTCERHADNKRQAMVTDAKCTDLLLPLFERARFADGWKLCAGFIEVKVFAVSADLLLGQ